MVVTKLDPFDEKTLLPEETIVIIIYLKIRDSMSSNTEQPRNTNCKDLV